MLTFCLALILVSLALSLPTCGLVVRVAQRLGHVDSPDADAGGRKWHRQPTPNTGGVAIFWAVALPLLAGMAAAWWAPALVEDRLPALQRHLSGIRDRTPLALGILGGAAAVHVLGLVDDRRRLSAWPKLVGQVVVAVVLATTFELRIFEFLGNWYGLAGVVAAVTLTVLWLVAITNALNFLDNMDGLAAGVGAIIAGVYLAANLIGGQWFVAALCALLLGALLGFLVFNFPPARLFMGDGGSLVLGYFLAVISVRTTYVGRPAAEALIDGGAWYGVLMPLVVMAVPLYDLTSVTLLRIAQGRNPMVGDRQHFSHRLVRRGLSQRAAVIVVWMCTLATGLGGVMLRTLEPWQALLVAGQTAAMLAVLALLERGPAGRGEH